MARSDYITYLNEIANLSSSKEGRIGNVDSVKVHQTPTQEQLCKELEISVVKHYRYLCGLEGMQYVKPSKWFILTKRVIDISVSIFGLILLSPLFLIVAILIKLDSKGPVLFSQIRVGKDGKQFNIYKFRTMVADAERKTGPVWAKENDPRLTSVGKILRKYKIDEFPQFINLIKGEMSLVGPRPERPFFVDFFIKLIPGYCYRLKATPGLTGPAQIRNGYDHTGLDVIRKLRYDVYYVKKRSLFMDLYIIFETFISVLKGKF